jgi:FKBP-type peptidyl-prolyl cis-trans isomerase FklB
MKKIMILALALVASASFSSVEAGKKKDKKKAATEVKVEPVVLKSSSDSLSYAAGVAQTNGLLPYLKDGMGVDTAYLADFIEGFKQVVATGSDPKVKARLAGMDIANQVMQRMLPGMKKEFVDTPDSLIDQLLFRGFADGVASDTTVMTMAQAETLFRQKLESNKSEKEERLYGANREAGRKFLAENKTKEGVVETPSGLQYKVLVKGNGQVPQPTDKVQVNYEGRLVDGTVFDASAKHGDKPATFLPTQVIKGWTEALTMMPVGSKWQLYIPYELAYGSRDMGNIKPFSALIFDVELVGIEK